MTQAHNPLRARVHLSTLVLATVATFDLVTTLMLLARGMQEGNPLFAPFLAYGPLVFALVKVAFVAGPILILELARRYRPMTAEVGTWVASALYVYLYVGHVLRLA